ncbi:MAG: alcohol dehydrogenase catalytic domain-containing protein [Chloroflexi bacterium]|nr:alcohol dehydrogenase catalytic domain-containing protein [Chloroflexota bacterium]
MVETMRGLVMLGQGKVDVWEFPKPKPTGTQVLVAVKAAGLCGSDLHKLPNPAEGRADRRCIRGHEPAGVVAEVGEAVTMVKVGDRVSVYHAPSCGHCEPCLRGEFFNCTTIGPGNRLGTMRVDGGDADYVLVDQNVCFPLPDELSFEDGAIIACAGGTAYHALRRADVRAGEYVLISGLGPVGLCAVQVAVAMGGIVLGVDPEGYRRELALRHGARYVLDPLQEDMPARVVEITAGGAEVVVETSGNDQARVDVLRATPYHARLIYVGFGGRARNAMLGPHLGGRWVTGSNMFTAADYYELVRLMKRQGFHFHDLVTHRFPLEKAQEAFDTFASRKTGKVMFVWE